jgi:hypothetical protein
VLRGIHLHITNIRALVLVVSLTAKVTLSLGFESSWSSFFGSFFGIIFLIIGNGKLSPFLI